jgi:NTE family protein
MTSLALVLGGGGVTGVAWEIGMPAGPAEAGVDLGDTDVVIGTSAGSVVGAQVAGGRNVLDPARRAPAARAGRSQAAHEPARVAAVW